MGREDILLSRITNWSYLRQQLNHAALRPIDALRLVLGVYSSHPTAPLALLSRSKSFDASTFSGLEKQRLAVRIPAMRQSIFLVPTETAGRMLAATRLSPEKHAWRLRKLGLDLKEYNRLKACILELTQKPIAPRDLQKGLGNAGSEVRIMGAVRTMTYEGLVLRLGSSLRTDSLQYVATEAWLGHPLENADQELSLKWLAEEYLRNYGPARIEDFAWWCGISRRQAAQYFSTMKTIDIGRNLLLLEHQRHAFDNVEPTDDDVIDLLPKWDPYTMGYAPDGRQRFVADEHLSEAYTTEKSKQGATAGDGLPLMLRGRRAVATWSHKFGGEQMLVEVAPFGRTGISPRLYEAELEKIALLLGTSKMKLAPAKAFGKSA